MSWYARLLTETITYWAISSRDQHQKPTWAAPQSVKARWEDRAERFTDRNGRDIVSRAIVLVDTDLAVEGYLYRGTSAASDPTTVSGALPIERFDKIPDPQGREYLRRAWL